MQHAVTMHDEAGEAAEGRTLRCCRSTRAQTPPKKPVEQWWLPSILDWHRPFQWCNHFPETRSNPTPSGSHHISLLRRMRAHTCDTAAFTGETYFQKLRKKCRHARSLGIAMGGPSLALPGGRGQACCDDGIDFAAACGRRDLVGSLEDRVVEALEDVVRALRMNTTCRCHPCHRYTHLSCALHMSLAACGSLPCSTLRGQIYSLLVLLNCMNQRSECRHCDHAGGTSFWWCRSGHAAVLCAWSLCVW